MIMDDRRRQEIALWWLEPLLHGRKERNQEELRDKFFDKNRRHLDRRTIEVAKREAFARGLVEFRAKLIVPPSTRDPTKEAKLSSKYNLVSSIVVRSSEGNMSSDQIHTQIAYHVAQSIADAPGFFSENSIIGIGSGRAIHFFVDSFRLLSKQFNVKNITVMSLTGTVYPNVPISRQDQLLDADINTVEFAKFFNQLTRIRTICFPIALHDIDAMRRNTWLHSPHEDLGSDDADADVYASNRFSEHVPNYAFVGVGVLGHNHRLYREMHPGNDPHPSTMLDPIRHNLCALIDASQEVTDRYKGAIPYFPVADICHRLLFIEPPNDFALESGEEERLLSLIDKVNSNMLTVTKRQLNKVKNVVLIAGTEEKSLAIQRLLERNDLKKNRKKACPVIGTLCTDEATADKLLAAK